MAVSLAEGVCSYVSTLATRSSTDGSTISVTCRRTTEWSVTSRLNPDAGSGERRTSHLRPDNLWYRSWRRSKTMLQIVISRNFISNLTTAKRMNRKIWEPIYHLTIALVRQSTPLTNKPRSTVKKRQRRGELYSKVTGSSNLWTSHSEVWIGGDNQSAADSRTLETR